MYMMFTINIIMHSVMKFRNHKMLLMSLMFLNHNHCVSSYFMMETFFEGHVAIYDTGLQINVL